MADASPDPDPDPDVLSETERETLCGLVYPDVDCAEHDGGPDPCPLPQTKEEALAFLAEHDPDTERTRAGFEIRAKTATLQTEE